MLQLLSNFCFILESVQVFVLFFFTPVIIFHVIFNKDCEAHRAATPTSSLWNSKGSEGECFFPVYASFIKFSALTTTTSLSIQKKQFKKTIKAQT